ncbi:hypothetical protein ACFIQG_20315 [Comamonas odontotermitis]|uniref:hypothetical protein n=1 Tax=Comamonas odontotermitis TaxID=379895 RepID=UPI0036727DBD
MSIKYALRLLWHGSILLGRVSWILVAGFFTLFGPLLMAFLSEDEGKSKATGPDYFDSRDPLWWRHDLNKDYYEQ